MANPTNFNFLGSSGGTGTTGGHTAFGTVPNPISVAPNIFSQSQSAIPNFGTMLGGNSNLINSELSGQVSPQTLNALRTASAQWGVNSGMPGSGLQANQLFGNIAGYSENRQRQGLQDFLSTLTGVGHTLTDPSLATDVAARNANMAAAPDPRLSAERQLQEWLTKFNLTRNFGGGSPAGGTGAWGAGGRPMDAPSYGGYHGATDALGFPISDMSGGAMGNAWNTPQSVFGPTGTEHIPAGAGGALNPNLTVGSGTNPFLWPGNPKYSGNGYYYSAPTNEDYANAGYFFDGGEE